jgi:hypothetical protein
MATRKKSKKKSTRSKKSDGKRSPVKQSAQRRRTPKKLSKRKAVPEKPAAKKKAPSKTISGKTGGGIHKKRRNQSQRPGSSALSRESSGLQSGDLQGLSNVESVDSESVDELMEEGNAFEAGVVSGVEDSRERNGKEVRTREVPEDDVPGEYLDEQ